jgi:hypothetical protein
MPSLTNQFNEVLANTMDFKPDIIYLSVGSALGHHPQEINPNTNQQIPIFLDKYNGKKKVIILIDPGLETPLKSESTIPMEIYFLSDDGKFRIFRTTCGNTLIFAISSRFYWEDEKHCPHEDSQLVPICNNFLVKLIEFNLHNKSKLIGQDFTGRDTRNAYNSLGNIFDKNEYYKRVLFDITYGDSGCFVDFSKSPIIYDQEDNFVQVRNKKLIELRRILPHYFKKMAESRINLVLWHLNRQLRIFRGELTHEPFHKSHFRIICNEITDIYSIPDLNSIDEETIKHIIIIVLSDILDSLDIPSAEIISEIQKVNFNQGELIKIFGPIRAVINEL